MNGLPNIGSTCWLNALVQCMRIVIDPTTMKTDTEFKTDFFKIIRGESDDTSILLKHMPADPFGNNPSDSQEAFLYIIDKLDLKQFVGEVTQTIIYPGGRSVKKDECTIWFEQKRVTDVVQGYTDDSGKTHKIAVIQRELTRVPDILVSDAIHEELFGKKLVGIIHWGFGHYVAFVKFDGDWWCADDASVTKVTPVLKGYIGFYI